MLHVNVLSLGALLWKTQGRSFWALGVHFPNTDNQKPLVGLTSMIIITPIARCLPPTVCACLHFFLLLLHCEFYDSTDFPRCMPYASYTFYFHFCFRATAAPHIITAWLQELCAFPAFYLLLLHIVLFLHVLLPFCACLCVTLCHLFSLLLLYFTVFFLSPEPLSLFFDQPRSLLSFLFSFASTVGLSFSLAVCLHCESQSPWWCALYTLPPPIALPPSCVNMPVIWAAPPCAESQVGG